MGVYWKLGWAFFCTDRLFVEFHFTEFWKRKRKPLKGNARGCIFFPGPYLLFLQDKLVSIYRSSPPEVFLGKGVLKICSKFTGEHSCGSAISVKLQRNFTEITRQHGCSPLDLLHIFRTPFTKSTSKWLLLQKSAFGLENNKCICQWTFLFTTYGGIHISGIYTKHWKELKKFKFCQS